MENYKVEASKYTLEVDFNAENGIFKLSGSSYPENALEFFDPIMDWIKKYIKEVKGEINLILYLDYLNTSSTKCMLDLFELLEEYHEDGGVVKGKWYYAEDDEDIMETGEELSEDIAFPMEILAY